MKSRTILVATVRPWNVELYRAWQPPRGFRKHLVTTKEGLMVAVKKYKPAYIFFPHWSWIIPPEIYTQHECIVVHMTDLPFGRGGSPLQNLIVRGIQKTKVSTLRVTGGLDEGPVYMKRSLNIRTGSAEEIFRKVSKLGFAMFEQIIQLKSEPRPQVGVPTLFSRRTPEQSLLPNDTRDLSAVYDFIRMLDAPEYPHAYFEYGNYRFELTAAHYKSTQGTLEAKVSIRIKK